MERSKLLNVIGSPAAVTLLVLIAYLGSVLVKAGGDPLAFVRIGEHYQSAGAVDPEGYDGQFVYYIARDPAPDSVAPYLDVPAYRYQRILMPLLARALSFGQEESLPWVLVTIGLVSHIAGVVILDRLMVHRGTSRWFALVYGLWAGLLLAIRLDLPEPLAYALAAGAIAAGDERRLLRWTLFGLAVFAKEIVLLFIAGQLLVDAARSRWRDVVGLAGIALLPFSVFQGWLYAQFGAIGPGSGGAMATSFEWIPFMGWIRIGAFSVPLMMAFGVFIVPLFFAPAVWAIAAAGRRLLKRSFSPESGYLFLNAVVIPFLPFSTVREPGGLFRFGTGFVLAYLLYAARHRVRRALLFAVVWLALIAVIVNELTI